MGRRLPQRIRALAAVASRRLHRRPACRDGMGDEAPSRREKGSARRRQRQCSQHRARHDQQAEQRIGARRLANTIVETASPALIKARSLMDQFHAMMRTRKPEKLAPWIAAAKQSNIAAFAAGIETDQAAVRAAIVEPWSSGQVEGQVTLLKLVKRQMYGRAHLDLLKARLMDA